MKSGVASVLGLTVGAMALADLAPTTRRRRDANRPGFLEARATKAPIRKSTKRKAQRLARRIRRLNDNS